MNISTFAVAVEEVFEFSDGTTVFVGRPDPAVRDLAPCHVDVVVDERPLGRVCLTAERAQGGRAGLRSVETRDPVDVTAIRGHLCVLVHREQDV